MASALLAIQRAIFAKLSGDTALMALVKGVFDDVPENQAFPYVVIGEATETPSNTFGRKGKDVTCTIHIWSQAKGNTEALTILDRLNDLLDFEPLAVAGYEVIAVEYENAVTLREPDGVTRQVPVRYRVRVKES